MIKIFIFLFPTNSLKLGVYFALTAHLNSTVTSGYYVGQYRSREIGEPWESRGTCLQRGMTRVGRAADAREAPGAAGGAGY